MILPGADNFGAILVDADDAPTEQEVANIKAARAAAAASNADLILGPLGSELNGAAVNVNALAGDALVPMPSEAKTATKRSQD